MGRQTKTAGSPDGTQLLLSTDTRHSKGVTSALLAFKGKGKTAMKKDGIKQVLWPSHSPSETQQQSPTVISR